jgi:hypothetical protein
MGCALEAGAQRLRHHLRRPVPGRRDLLINRQNHRYRDTPQPGTPPHSPQSATDDTTLPHPTVPGSDPNVLAPHQPAPTRSRSRAPRTGLFNNLLAPAPTVAHRRPAVRVSGRRNGRVRRPPRSGRAATVTASSQVPHRAPARHPRLPDPEVLGAAARSRAAGPTKPSSTSPTPNPQHSMFRRPGDVGQTVCARAAGRPASRTTPTRPRQRDRVRRSGPARGESPQTSMTTGTIIGRRLVRSCTKRPSEERARRLRVS